MGSIVPNSIATPLKRVPTSKLHTVDSVRVLATGAFVPENVVRNEDLARLGCDADWIIKRTGIRERRHAPDGMATSDMAFEAAQQCIEQIDADVSDIDLILVATMTPDSQMPSTACILQERLGISGPAMDINAACAGFMYALLTGIQFVNAGTSQLALIVGADVNSRIIDPGDPKTYPLFGDGAGAVLIGERVGGSKTSYTLGADGSGKDLLLVPAGGSRMPMTSDLIGAPENFIQMDGRSVFKWAVRMVAESIQDVVQHAGLSVQDIDLFVLHQANCRIIDAIADALGVASDKFMINLDRYGNTSAGSIPLALHEAAVSGRIEQGNRLLLSGFGAGLTWGTAVMEW